MEEHLSEEMYREHILDLYKNPRNFGIIENPTHMHTENNPLCGDEVTIQLIIENDRIKDIKFAGKGCAISMASSSLLTDKAKGMKIDEAKNLGKEDVLKILRIPISYGRLKCALLPLDSLNKSLADNGEK